MPLAAGRDPSRFVQPQNPISPTQLRPHLRHSSTPSTHLHQRQAKCHPTCPCHRPKALHLSQPQAQVPPGCLKFRPGLLACPTCRAPQLRSRTMSHKSRTLVRRPPTCTSYRPATLKTRTMSGRTHPSVRLQLRFQRQASSVAKTDRGDAALGSPVALSPRGCLCCRRGP